MRDDLRLAAIEKLEVVLLQICDGVPRPVADNNVVDSCVLISATGSLAGFESCDVIGDDGAGAGDDWGAAVEFGDGEAELGAAGVGGVCARKGTTTPTQQSQRKVKRKVKGKARPLLGRRLTVEMPMGNSLKPRRSYSSIHPYAQSDRTLSGAADDFTLASCFCQLPGAPV